MARKDTLRLVCTHPIFLHLSKVPSVSVSEISHIPISRCSAVSRLDRIRTLRRSMSPLGVWNKQRCVASSTVGHRTPPGSCYSAEWKRGLLNFRGRKVHDICIIWRKKVEKKENDFNANELYNPSQVLMTDYRTVTHFFFFLVGFALRCISV